VKNVKKDNDAGAHYAFRHFI